MLKGLCAQPSPLKPFDQMPEAVFEFCVLSMSVSGRDVERISSLGCLGMYQ